VSGRRTKLGSKARIAKAGADVQSDARTANQLHQRIRSDIEAKVISGQWPVGYRIPTEQQLMVQYDCSRMTVNKAISTLAVSGMIERRKRAGSFVSQPRTQAAILEIADIRAEIATTGLPYRMEVVHRRKRLSTSQDMRRLDVRKPREVLAILCLHYAGPHVHALEDRLIDLAAVPMAAGVKFGDEPPGTWLQKNVPWTEAQHRIRAVAIDEETAQLMQVSVNTPCLEVERATWRSGRPVTAVRILHPSENYCLTARFSPSHGQSSGSGRLDTGRPKGQT
jgi:GntR family histidine utilization transcriptional repressor